MMRDFKITRLLLFLLLFSGLAVAQFTLVSATVVDPNGTPYANGTVSAQLITAGSTPTLNGLGFSMTSGPANLSAAGSFTMSLVSNTSMVPGTLKWQFTVCSSAGTILPAGGTGPVCFISLITITGATQSLSATLSAAAPKLSNGAGASSSLAATVTIPAAGTTFNPATGTTTQFKTATGNAFDFFVGATNTFPTTPGLFIDDPIEDANGTYLQDAQGDNIDMDAGIFIVSGSGGNQIGLFDSGAGDCGVLLAGNSTAAQLFLGPQAGCTIGLVPGLYFTDTAGDVLKIATGVSSFTGITQSAKYASATNCAVNSVSPAACGSAAAGAVVVPTTTATYTVNTSAVTAASRVFLMPMSFAGNLPSAPTCVSPTITTEPTISAISTGVSFTFAFASTVGQTCWQYWIVN